MQNKKPGPQSQGNNQNNMQQRQNLGQPNTNQGDMMDAQQNVSLEQLQQLMKDPQIAKFIQEQVQLQERGGTLQQPMQQKYHDDQRRREDQNLNVKTQNSVEEGTLVNPKGLNTLKCNDSNMNSDTSQEILQYQREWAKKFNDHVAIQKSGYGNVADMSVYSQQQNQEQQEQERKVQTPSELKAIKQYQQVLRQADDPQEHINLLPQSAFDANALQQSNNINFYGGERHDTEHSGFPDAQILQQNNRAAPQNQINIENHEQEERSRNIMNGGKQLTLMTDCSDVVDYSAEVNLDDLEEDSQASQKGEEDEYLTFQLCEGEEMNEEMSNFIVLHMLNDGCLDGEEQSKNEEKSGLTYECPKTGSHFDFTDLNSRLGTLKQKRNQIDEAMKLEDSKKMIQKRNAKAIENYEIHNNLPRGSTHLKHVEQSQLGIEGWFYKNPENQKAVAMEKAKKKQIEKQKKLKAQVQNIIKSAQQDDEDEDDLNDSLQQDDEALSLEGEEHFATYNITRNTNILQSQSHKIPQKHTDEGQNEITQQYNQNNINKKANVVSGKSVQQIYNTHDGRQKQQVGGPDKKSQQQYHVKTQDVTNNQKYYKPSPNRQQIEVGQPNRYITQPSQISTSYHSTNKNMQPVGNPNQKHTKNAHSQQIQQHGQTSKISQFSKQPTQTHQTKHGQQQLTHDEQQQMIMNLRQTSGSYHQKPGDSNKIPQSSKYKQTSKKPMGNLGLSQNSISFNNQGVGTMIHSNQLSSLVATNAQNSNQVNTEVVSQRGEGRPSWAENNYNNSTVQSNPSSKYQTSKNVDYHSGPQQKTKPKTAVGAPPYGSNYAASKITKAQVVPSNQYMRKHAGENQGEYQTTNGSKELTQTAKFGPQVMRAEIPYQSNKMQPMGSNEMTVKHQQDIMAQQQKQYNVQKMTQQQMEFSKMQQRQVESMALQKKPSSKNNNGSWTGKGFKQNNPKAQGLGQVGSQGQNNLMNMNNIQQNQNQRKNQHINTGGNMIGYNMAKKAQVSVGTEGQIIVPQSCSAKIGGNMIRSVGTSSNQQNIPYANNTNSMGRTSDQSKVPITNDARHQQQIKQNYNQMPHLNQQYFQNESKQQHHQVAKDASPTLIQSGVQTANINHHGQSYSFDYRQQKNAPQPKIQSSHYASINSMNNNGTTKGRMSSGGDGMPVKISSMNNNRLQDIINEGSSKKVNPSMNQMGKILRSFDSHQVQKSNMMQQQKKVSKNQKEEIYGDINSMQEFTGNMQKPQVYQKQIIQSNNKQVTSQKQQKVIDGNTSMHGQYNSNTVQMREEQHQKSQQQSNELAQMVKKSQHKKTKSSSNAIYVTQQKGAPQKTYDARQHMQQTDKNINNVRQSYNSMGATNKLRNNTSQNMVAPKMSTAFENPFNQHHMVDPNQVEDDQIGMSGQGQINQPFNNIDQRAKGLVTSKPKRVTAATREIHSGTSARVNTFDNRGIQAQNTYQYPPQQMNRHQQPNPQQQMKGQPLQHPQGIMPSQEQESLQSQSNPQRSHQSPKQNIYLVNYQGNVQII